MRLTSRFLALALLLVIAAFTMVVTPVSQADACTDGCMRDYEFCMGGNPPNQSQCSANLTKCQCKCNPCPEAPPEN
jgi:hypothetical protein